MLVEAVFGPPGTGKTTELLRLMEAAMERGVPPHQVAFVTFTKAARERAILAACERFGMDRSQLPYFATLHSICFREMGLHREQVLSSEHQLADLASTLRVEFSQSHASKWSLDGELLPVRPEATDGDRMLALDHWMRHREMDPRQAHRLRWPDISWFEFQRFSIGYAQFKAREDLIDFTDMLRMTDAPLPVKVAFVDEAQDLSDLQWRCFWGLVRSAESVHIAGDDDQAIFEWAGANPSILRSVGSSRVLSHSYRLPATVHARAAAVSRRIKLRADKQFTHRGAMGSVHMAESVHDVDFGPSEEWLILARTHSNAREAYDRLRDLRVQFKHPGGCSRPEGVGRAAGCWEDLRRGLACDAGRAAGVLEFIATGRGLRRGAKSAVRGCDPGRGLSMPDLVREFGVECPELPWFEVFTAVPLEDRLWLASCAELRGLESLDQEPRIRVSTIHGAKGSEAPNVAVISASTRKVREGSDLDPDAERRVWYVALTRSSDRLVLVGENSATGDW